MKSRVARERALHAPRRVVEVGHAAAAAARPNFLRSLSEESSRAFVVAEARDQRRLGRQAGLRKVPLASTTGSAPSLREAARAVGRGRSEGRIVAPGASGVAST